ncbi:MAG TPA: hypothetical protein VFI00_06265 [Kribbella sp.]|nr:hypothetical protein [Kribbella sp.]
MTTQTSPDTRLAAALRFATELIAWVATPWALAPYSIPLAVASVVVLIGLPTIFQTPGDKPRVIVAVPGVVTILLVLLQLAAAVAAAWVAWPMVVAVLVSLLAVACVVTEQPRWRWLLRASRAD